MIRSRIARGQQLADFSVAFGFFIVFIVVPLVDLGIVPIRFLMAQSTVSNFIKQLSLCEKASDAFGKVKSDNGEFEKMFSSIGGTHVKSSKLAIVINSQKKPGTQTEVEKAKSIPKIWLPEGENCPCQYMLKLSVDLEIDPLVAFAKAAGGIPGLNAPFAINITDTVPWENLGVNPATQEYFLNE